MKKYMTSIRSSACCDAACGLIYARAGYQLRQFLYQVQSL